jgi:hypothetical protein
MSDLPRFNSGQIGRLAYSHLNQSFSASDWVNANLAVLNKLVSEAKAGKYDRRKSFDAIISTTTAPTVITADQQWLYTVEEIKWQIDGDNVQPVSFAGGIVGTATSPIERRNVSQYEMNKTECPDSGEGDSAGPGILRRSMIPQGTPVRCRWITTNGERRIIIDHLLGFTHVCDFCPDPEPEE